MVKAVASQVEKNRPCIKYSSIVSVSGLFVHGLLANKTLSFLWDLGKSLQNGNVLFAKSSLPLGQINRKPIQWDEYLMAEHLLGGYKNYLLQ